MSGIYLIRRSYGIGLNLTKVGLKCVCLSVQRADGESERLNLTKVGLKFYYSTKDE